MPDGLSLDTTDAPPPGDVDILTEGLDAYNAGHAPDADYRPLAVFVRDAEGRPRGGIVGSTFWGWLHIDLVWVDESLRGSGWGSRLLAAAEAEGRARGCRGAALRTLSFQAPEFYRRHGYAVVGEVPDLPPGHRRLYMTKALGPGSPD